MTALRRLGLGVLTVLLLAVAAAAVGSTLRQSTGPDLADGTRFEATPSPVAHDGPEPAEPTREPAPAPAEPTVEPAVDPAVEPVEPAVAPRPTPPPLEPGKPLLQQGDEGLEVRDLQARLRALAWYFSTPTGVYDADTVEAI